MMGGERILLSAPAPPPAPRAGDTDCGMVPAAWRSASRHRCRENPIATSHRHGTVLELLSRPRSAAALSGPSRLQPTAQTLAQYLVNRFSPPKRETSFFLLLRFSPQKPKTCGGVWVVVSLPLGDGLSELPQLIPRKQRLLRRGGPCRCPALPPHRLRRLALGFVDGDGELLLELSARRALERKPT